MRWRWWRAEPEPGEHNSWPDHGRDSAGRLVDGDTVRPDGRRSSADLLPGYQADAGREALTEPSYADAAWLAGAGRGTVGLGVPGFGVAGHGKARELDQSTRGLSASDEQTRVLPVVTPAQLLRGEGGGWRR